MAVNYSGIPNTILSIIVPAYNVENYIVAALESVLKQPHSNLIELVVVDDGSTDNTFDHILSVKRDWPDHTIIVINQANRGVSAARNLAIDQATSPYIGFLDSDDVWAPNFTLKILPLLQKQVADIIEFNVGIVNDTGKEIGKVTLIKHGTEGLRKCDLNALLDFAKVYQVFPVARVYKRELWQDIEFPIGQVYEDTSAIPLVYVKAKTLYRLSDKLYFYRRRRGSITTKANLHTVTSLTSIAQETLIRCDGSLLDPFWLAVFHKVFAYACYQASRVDANAFTEAMNALNVTHERYRNFAAYRSDTPESIDFHTDVMVKRRIFLLKRMVKQALGKELKPQTAINTIRRTTSSN